MKSKSIAFFFPHPASETLSNVASGKEPSERLYGAYELMQQGWNITICDDQFIGASAKLSARLRKAGVFIPTLRSLFSILKHDIIVIKDDYSTLTTCFARLTGKKIIYMDALFQIPRHPLKRLIMRINANLATTTIVYSQYQIMLWEQKLKIHQGKLRFLPYSIDYSFYQPQHGQETKEPFIIAVGRDTGREFNTLVECCRKLKVHLKLITLPYLIPDNAKKNPYIEILERLSYAELFDIYASATCAIVTLKANITYPSGIRAVLEALALEKTTIATETPVLKEYFSPCDSNLIFVEAQNADMLCSAISKVLSSQKESALLTATKSNRRENRYSMEVFAQGMACIFSELC